MTIKIEKKSLIILSVFVFAIFIWLTVIFNPGQRADSQTLAKSTEINSSSSLAQISNNSAPVSGNTGNKQITGSGQRKSATLGDVTLDVDPKKFGGIETETTFTLSFNTHSVSLDYDFTKIVTLQDDRGKDYQASLWTGPRGGHHMSGDIVFPPLDSGVKQVTLTVTGLAGQNASLAWDVDN